MRARLFVLLQYLLPRFWMTAVVYRVARIRKAAVKDFLISRFVRLYDVDISQVKHDVPAGFLTFNDFFVRELEDGARPIASESDAIASPVDGTVSAAGNISGEQIFQAKGLDYSLDDLLATDLQDAQKFIDGSFATIYLAPYNYHRVHAPLDGEILAARYVPGDLFSVNAATVANVAGLFRRNERLVLHFRTAHGPAAVILVGALNVGSISTPWSGEVRPKKHGVVEMIDISQGPREIRKGELLGCFNMGSTVILLLPQNAGNLSAELQPGATVLMGQPIGSMPAQ
jgi:phosphatidylserine decarboxylase